MDSGSCAGTSMVRARGVALLTCLMVLVLTSSVIVFHRIVRDGTAPLAREVATARSLSDARAALVAWAVVSSTTSGKGAVPGVLPFPDRNRDGNYDGKGDCVTF